MAGQILHPDFKPRPFWWEAAGTEPEAEHAPPARTDVLIVGAGLTGLNCAIELARGGAQALALDAEAIGFGASTRNGGGVSGGNSIGKGLSGFKARQSPAEQREWLQAILGGGANALTHIEGVIERENIACHYERTGRFGECTCCCGGRAGR